MQAPSLAIAAPRIRRRGVWALFALALLVDLLICVPFVLDPLGLRQAGAGQDAAPADYLVFLAAHTTAAQLADFAAAHPGVRVAHRGAWLDTAVLTLGGGGAQATRLLDAVRAQPWARLVTPNGAVFCR